MELMQLFKIGCISTYMYMYMYMYVTNGACPTMVIIYVGLSNICIVTSSCLHMCI